MNALKSVARTQRVKKVGIYFRPSVMSILAYYRIGPNNEIQFQGKVKNFKNNCQR